MVTGWVENLLGEENIESLPLLLDHAYGFEGVSQCVHNAPGICQCNDAGEDPFPPCHFLQ